MEVKAQPKTASSTLGQSTISPNQSFLFGNGSEGTSTNVPIPPKMPAVSLVGSFNSAATTPPAPPPVPPIAPSMPDLVSDAGNSTSSTKSTLLQSIRDFGGKLFKLKKVKEEPKVVVVSSDEADLMSQILARREAIAGEDSSTKPKKVVRQTPKLTEEEIARKKAENLARYATIREQNKKQWEEAARKNEEIARERRRVEAEAVKARLEQKRKERGETTDSVINGVDPAFHHNIVTELRSEIAVLREQLSLNGNMTVGAINDIDSNDNARSKRSLEGNRIVETKDQSTSTEDLIVLEERLYDEKLENWEFEEDEAIKKDEVSSNYDDLDEEFAKSIAEIEEMLANEEEYEQQAEDSSSNIKVADNSESMSQAVQQELVDIQKALQSQKLKEVAVVEAVEDLQEESIAASILEILDEDKAEEGTYEIPTNLRNTAVTELQDQQTAAEGTITSKEDLLKKASMVASSKAQACQASKIASSHIKHRIFAKDILAAAIAAGDESEADQSQSLGYSVWSSGAFESAKQKISNNTDGYSSKILGGTIGADVEFESELLLRVSFSKIKSNIKHATQKETRKLNTYIASLYGTSTIKENLTLGVIGSAGFSPKPRAKLFSLDTHLNYQIALPQKIKLIPNIGLKYEYERSKGYQEQLTSNMFIACSKKSYQALSTEIGSRVIFAPIKLKEVGTSNVILSNTILTPTAHFSVERRIGSRGGSGPYHLTYQELGQTIWAGSLSANAKTAKTSLNTGIGLIASHKNIKLELLYDHTRQKRFKAHQGMLKLKVSL
ncbi:hypothetical protein A8V33_04020 [Rickettsia sp. wb]|nr:hypothetical protein A8V33_04020 [Rickettsia sp. wb]